MRFLLRCACLCLCAGTLRADTFLVLPFSNASQNASLEWIGESVAESVREALAAQGVLALAREERLEAYRRLSIRPYTLLTRASVLKLGEVLDAGQVVYGEYEFTPAPDGNKLKGQLRLVARVLDVQRLRRGPEYQEAGPLEDLASLQTHLAWQTLQFVAPKTAPSEQEYQQARPPVRVEAIESYVRGLIAGDAEQKLKLFAQALRLDARFAQPSLETGLIHWRRRAYRPAADAFAKVGPADPQYRVAAFHLGLCRFALGDYAAAQQAFRTVAQEVPLSEVLNNLGVAQLRAGSPEALDTLRRALEGDMGDPTYHFNVGYALFRRGELAEAAERFRAVLARTPEDPQARLLLDWCLNRSGVLPGGNLDRLKQNYDESAWLQLKAVMEKGKDAPPSQ